MLGPVRPSRIHARRVIDPVGRGTSLEDHTNRRTTASLVVAAIWIGVELNDVDRIRLNGTHRRQSGDIDRFRRARNRVRSDRFGRGGDEVAMTFLTGPPSWRLSFPEQRSGRCTNSNQLESAAFLDGPVTGRTSFSLRFLSLRSSLVSSFFRFISLTCFLKAGLLSMAW